MSTPVRLDRLSALLEGLKPRVDVMRPPADARELTFDASSDQQLYLHLVLRGRMHLHAAGMADITVAAPAILVCRANQAHTLTADPQQTLASLMCATASLEGPVASLLLDEFSAPLAVPLHDADASLGHVLQLISSELLEPRCGQPALLERAGDILFIGLLRHLVAQPRTSSGLFNGLADPRIAGALVAMHAAPQDNWTLERLATEAGMSRTAFATRFREVMRHPPGKYLGQLRLSIAHRAVTSGLGLKRAARDSGYASVSALSRALSRARLSQQAAPTA